MGGNCSEVDRFDDDVGEGVVPGRRDLSLAGLAGGGGEARTLTVGDIDVGERDTFLSRVLGSSNDDVKREGLTIGRLGGKSTGWLLSALAPGNVSRSTC